ncbi:hypothetical protein LXL04_035661 [Taraxacum kok-saghyz]
MNFGDEVEPSTSIFVEVKTFAVCGPHLQPSAAEEVDQTSASTNRWNRSSIAGKIEHRRKRSSVLLLAPVFLLLASAIEKETRGETVSTEASDAPASSLPVQFATGSSEEEEGCDEKRLEVDGPVAALKWFCVYVRTRGRDACELPELFSDTDFEDETSLNTHTTTYSYLPTLLLPHLHPPSRSLLSAFIDLDWCGRSDFRRAARTRREAVYAPVIAKGTTGGRHQSTATDFSLLTSFSRLVFEFAAGSGRSNA